MGCKGKFYEILLKILEPVFNTLVPSNIPDKSCVCGQRNIDSLLDNLIDNFCIFRTAFSESQLWFTGPPREIWGPGAKFDLGALEILSCSTTKR